MKEPCIHILASKHNGTLYVGVTSDLIRRIYLHKNKLIKGFTSQYDVYMLVHVESFETMEQAIHREKCIKEWKRAWKLELIKKHNPKWNDLYEEYAAYA